jgi:hypothetical protein
MKFANILASQNLIFFFILGKRRGLKSEFLLVNRITARQLKSFLNTRLCLTSVSAFGSMRKLYSIVY